jgi:hypothetical protein
LEAYFAGSAERKLTLAGSSHCGKTILQKANEF